MTEIAAEGYKANVAGANKALSYVAGDKPINGAAICRALVIERRINKRVN